MTGPSRDAGSAVLETALVTPLLILTLAAVVGAGRVTLAHQRVEHLAAQAARAAATAISPQAAVAAATLTARTTIDGAARRECQQVTVDVDTRDFRPGGNVSVRVGCLADLGAVVPGLSGDRWIHARATEVVDTFREVRR